MVLSIIKNMKPMKHYSLILAIIIAIVCSSSCTKAYEKHWDLEVDSNAYTLSYSDGSFPLYVYCSGAWNASFDSDVDWIRIQDGTESGRGNGIVRISYRYNEFELRSVNLVITSGEFKKTVTITQKYDTIHMEVE